MSQEREPLPNPTDAKREVSTSHLNRSETVHPILGSFIGAREFSYEPVPLDTEEKIRELQTTAVATDYIQMRLTRAELSPLQRALAPLYPNEMHSVDKLNNQFAKKIMPHFMNPAPEAALLGFRDIVPNTTDEEMVLLVNDDQFRTVHTGLHTHLQQAEDTGLIDASVQENLRQIAMADRMQFNGNPKRSLEQMLRYGMELTIDPAVADCINESSALAGDGIMPLTEYIKNERIFGINGFS